MIEFIKNQSDDKIGKVINIGFILTHDNNSAFILLRSSGRRFSVSEIRGTIDTWFVETQPDKIISKSYITEDETQAKYVSFDNTNNGKIEVVLTKDNKKMFYTDLEGNTQELKTLGTYYPKSDTFVPGVSNALD